MDAPIVCPTCGSTYQARTYSKRKDDGTLEANVHIDTRCPVCLQRQLEGQTPQTPVRKPLGD